VEDAMNIFNAFVVDGGYMTYEKGFRPAWTEKGSENPVVTAKLLNTLWAHSKLQFYNDFTREALRVKFGQPKDEKLPKGYQVQFNTGENAWSADGSWKPDTYFVTLGNQILESNFATKEEAVQWAQLHGKVKTLGRKPRFMPPQLEHIRRDGPDYRRGRSVSGEDYLETFGFRGGEFGNWMSRLDRTTSLNMGYEALKDLADALKISDRDVSFGEQLAIAFGARGASSALAHYESLRQVINLTKMRGAGALAHEWWHGLDDYLGRQYGVKWLSEHPKAHPLMQKLLDTIRYKLETPEQAAEKRAAEDARIRRNGESWLNSTVMQTLQRHGDTAMEAYASTREAFLRGRPEAWNG